MSVDHIEAVEYQQLIHSQEVTDAVEVIGQTKQKLERGMWTTVAVAVIVIATRVFSVYQNHALGAVIVTGTALLSYIFAIQVTKKAETSLDRIRGVAKQLSIQEEVIKGVIGQERAQAMEESERLKGLARELERANELLVQIKERKDNLALDLKNNS